MKKRSLYPPAAALALVCYGVSLLSVAAALIVGGGVVLAGWLLVLALDYRWARK